MTRFSDGGWENLSLARVLSMFTDTAADEPPGAIAAVCVSGAASAKLLAKCTNEEAIVQRLNGMCAEFLALAVDDAAAYEAWRNGDSASDAIVRLPNRARDLARAVAAMATEMPPHAKTGSTDITTALRLAEGCAEAARAVAFGNSDESGGSPDAADDI
jgi:hypothetical protein